MATKKTTPSWTALIQSEMKKETRSPVGDGWKTSVQLRKEFPVGRVQNQRRLSTLVSSGAVEVFRGTARNASGSVSQQVWYRPIFK
jgi:hypothetical protein